MGGTVFKELPRLNKDDHMLASLLVNAELNRFARGNVKFFLPRTIQDKNSFGDIDIYVGYVTNEYNSYYMNRCNDFLDMFVTRIFNADFLGFKVIDARLGGATLEANKTLSGFASLLVEFDPEYKLPLAQIDISAFPNLKPDDTITKEWRDNYYNYGDCSNFIGRIASAHGFTFRYNGLYKKIKMKASNGSLIHVNHVGLKYLDEKSSVSIDAEDAVLLTNDWNEALTFLGLDTDQYKRGFKTQYDLFEWIISSDKYDYRAFLPSNRNHKSRCRDAKRSMYNDILRYIDDNGARDECESMTLQDMYKVFPETTVRYRECVKALRETYMVNRIISHKRIASVVKKNFEFNSELEMYKLSGAVHKWFKENGLGLDMVKSLRALCKNRYVNNKPSNIRRLILERAKLEHKQK